MNRIVTFTGAAMLCSTSAFAQLAYVPGYNQSYYVSNGDGTGYTGGIVFAVDPIKMTSTMIDLWPWFNKPYGVAVSKDGTRAYVTSMDASAVAVIDTKTNTQIAAFAVDLSPEGIAVSPNGKKLYVTHPQCWDDPCTSLINEISVLDSQYGQNGRPNITICCAPYSVAFVSNRKAYVGLYDSDPPSIAVIDATTDKVTKTIPLAGPPDYIVVSPNGNRAYVSSTSKDVVYIINTQMDKVTGSIATQEPWTEAVAPGGRRLIVGNTVLQAGGGGGYDNPSYGFELSYSFVNLDRFL